MYGESVLFPPTALDPTTLNVGQEGCFFDPRVLTTFRQDNSDTAAVVGQPVGMVIDTWVANTLGSDSVVNGTFTTNTASWVGGGTSVSLTAPSGRLRVTLGSATVSWASQSQTTVAGRVYKCTVDLVTNANGAQIAVGTTASLSNLYSRAIAGGTTGSFTFYFIATTTTSFIRLVSNSTTIGHFTEWDNVTCKHIPGKHIITQTSTLRPILRQLPSGAYWLEPDAVDDWLIGPLGTIGTTLQLPSYLCCVPYRKSDAIQTIFGMVKNTTNFHYIGNRTLNIFQGILREATIGQTVALLKPLSFGVGRCEAVDSLAVVGTNDIDSGRNNPASIANSWLVGSTITGTGPAIFTATGIGPSAGPSGFAGAVWMNSAPTLAQRAGIRRWFNDIVRGD